MATQPDLKHWHAANELLATQATAQLGAQLAGVGWSGGDVSAAVTTIYRGIVTAYRRSSSTLALQMYADMRRRAGIDGRSPKVMAPDPAPEWIDTKVASAFKISAKAISLAADSSTDATDLGPRESVDITGAHAVENIVTARLSNSMQRMVASGGRETVAMTSAEDGAKYTHAPTKPAAPRGDPSHYIRMPTNLKPCAFCVMLATRDSDWRSFKTAQSAEFVVGGPRGAERGSRRVGERYHDHCQCIAVPVWGTEELPFDRTGYYEMYAKASANAGTGKTKDVLAAMRQIYGIR
ncbi:Uncharacterised protein [Mycobacteroides abscessus subsp. abscessus]|uniref:VG15 protein n=1 Tax=Mycobacteroides abscessus TaxID=36809 RepID=UPI000929D972|nr:hypothetical protein [Mycobacteroides abscessus]SIM01002.1 Uncharacterised protein [Mycobacteroides abscessus subsp. abscessus]